MSDSTATSTARLRVGSVAIPSVATIAIPLLLLAPALWNGYPLLQYDTGGYLARWYEGYLVPSRSTVFGLYLHFGEPWQFWTNLAMQAVATLWVLWTTLRVFGVTTHFRRLAIGLTLIATTALPWLASMLLTDIFAGLSVLTLVLLVAFGERTSWLEKLLLFAFTAFAAATHTGTFGVLLGLCLAALLFKPLLGSRISWAGVSRGFAAVAVSAAMLLAANYALSGKLAWTPGGAGVTFGRMLQDGIVARYLNDHCGQLKLKLCPYRNELPATADDFLWGNSMFNTLGRFEGMDDEMSFIALNALKEYPAWQAKAALIATLQQLTQVATGEGTNGWLPHTYGIIERYLPDQARAMRNARQQHWDINFAAVNTLHVPVALGSMLVLLTIIGHAAWRRQLDDVTLLAGAVALALLGNALICGVVSGPHDRYGARMVWLSTFVALIVVARWFAARDSFRRQGLLSRKASTPSL